LLSERKQNSALAPSWQLFRDEALRTGGRFCNHLAVHVPHDVIVITAPFHHFVATPHIGMNPTSLSDQDSSA